MDTMTIDALIGQLETMRQCGIRTVFDGSIRDEQDGTMWCFVAVSAMLRTSFMADKEKWALAESLIQNAGFSPEALQNAAFTDTDRQVLMPIFKAAARLYETVFQMTNESVKPAKPSLYLVK